MLSELFILLLPTTIQIANGYFFDAGHCENIPFINQKFDASKITGKWYILHAPEGTPACMTVDLTVINATVYVDIERPLPEIFEFGFPAALLYKMKAVLPHDNSSYWSMSMPKPMNLFGPIKVRIPATDYNTYAAVYICKEYFYGKLSLAMILSRNKTLSNETATGLLDNFKRSGVDIINIKAISQTECNNVNSPSLFRDRENILPKIKSKGAIPDASAEGNAEVFKRTNEKNDAEHLFFTSRDEPISST